MSLVLFLDQSRLLNVKMSNDKTDENAQDYLSSFSETDGKLVREWLERNAVLIEQRADSWLEKGLRLVIFLNAGGVLALLTSIGVWHKNSEKASMLISSANYFITGLILAACGTVIATYFFNYVSKKTNDQYRKAVNHDLSVKEDNDADELISWQHTLFKNSVLFIIASSFVIFIIGSISSLSSAAY